MDQPADAAAGVKPGRDGGSRAGEALG